MSHSEIRPGIRRLFRLAVLRRDLAHDDADAEIRLHLQLRAEQLTREGMSPEAARAEAERRFGSLDEARERLHASAARREDRLRFRETLGSIAQDLRLALRGLRRAPGFTAVAVVCIALGVGANAAAYSVFEELLLQPLPVHAPEQLVNLSAPGPKPGNDQCNQSGACEDVFSFPTFRALQQATQSGLSGVAAHRLFLASVAVDGRAAQGDGVFVSGSYFSVLGLTPALGRLLGPADDVAPGAHAVAVVSHDYWTSQLGGDPTVIGKRLLVNGKPLTLVGVAPRGFQGTTLGLRPWVFVPILQAAELDPFFGPSSDFASRTRYWAYLFGRLRPGTSIAQAQAALTTVYRPLLRDLELPLHAEMSATTKARFLAREVAVTDGRHGQSTLRGSTRTPLVFLFAITGLVVLIACANIANLLLVRGAGRAAEMAVRMSLGAGRRRLVLQLLAESLVLAVVGGLVSIVVAYGMLRVIGSFIPAASVGFGAMLSLELRPSVLVFAGVVSLATGLLFGLFPALHGTRSELVTAIRSGAGQIPGGHRAASRFRSTLVTAQIAISVALLGCAGLFVRSLQNVGRVDLGMETRRVVQFALLPQLSGYDARRAHAALARAEDEVAAVPGVVGVAASGTPLLTGSNNGGNVRVEGFARGPDTDVNTRLNSVGPGFFRTMGIPLVAGREFGAGDRIGAPKVAVVNEAFARKFNLGRDAVGKRLARDDGTPEGTYDVEIVGLVRDAHYSGVKDAPPPILYTPQRQDSTVTAAMFYVRVAGAPSQVLRGIPAAVARVDRNLPVALLKPMDQQARENVFLDRMVGALSAGFAALATLLAAVGLFGVLAYTVAQRAREFGVRMALGADARRVRALVLGQMGRMVLVGSVVGVAGALAAGRAAGSLLFGLEGQDPTAVAAAVLVLGVVAFAAGWVPARRAARVSPAGALRGE
ncbi:ABC transporter permease [Roseisolibacter agri]|uniref:Macrolide export ATP-binding/permease protein MacB n=1 Tax=Roseisolibacter agri TaxID=2014610 RepID=A0AA37Q5B2_9BACT|nr:ABC transporter permease [Roseisolibacter agri]GLC26870.1 hypothetical protein rosag_33830 [Roseisolibacter agri]